MKERIDAICEMLKYAVLTADVGCDHGFVSYYLLKNNLSQKLLAIDISAPSLEKTKKLLITKKLSNRAEFLVCDGLNGITNQRPDQVVIAGMGGQMIVKILKEYQHLSSIRNLVLQPMNNVELLREVLPSLNFEITRDYIVQEGDKFYNIIHTVRGVQKIKKNQIQFGVIEQDYYNETYLNWLKDSVSKMNNIVLNLPNDLKYRDEVIKTIEKYNKQILKVEGVIC